MYTADFFQWLSQTAHLTLQRRPKLLMFSWQPAPKAGEFRVLTSLSTSLYHSCYGSMFAEGWIQLFLSLTVPILLLNCYTVDSRSFYTWPYLAHQLMNSGKWGLLSSVHSNQEVRQLVMSIRISVAFPFSGPNTGRTAEQHDAGKTRPAEESSLYCRTVPHCTEAPGSSNICLKETVLCQPGKPTT